jgi:SAM-dependent methyltransferase
MIASRLEEYRSPASGAPLALVAVDEECEGRIVSGTIADRDNGERFAIRNEIPRFVDGPNYAESFGEQWNLYRRLQLDSFNGSTLTRQRFYSGTGWRAAELSGRRVLEAGCGAGRFSEILLEAGAHLYSFDYSSAVDAAWENHRDRSDWQLCQADIYALPYPKDWFDYVFCYGVLQHTPKPRRAFENLLQHLKPGGRIAIDVYRVETRLTKLAAKYWYRPLTRRLPRSVLWKLLRFYLPWWTPIDRLLQRVPGLSLLAVLVPCWNKSDLPIAPELRRDWTILDTFDALSARYDQPQRLETVRLWFEEAGLAEINVRAGGNGVLASARKPENR